VQVWQEASSSSYFVAFVLGERSKKSKEKPCMPRPRSMNWSRCCMAEMYTTVKDVDRASKDVLDESQRIRKKRMTSGDALNMK